MKHPQLSTQRSDYRSSSMPPLRRALFGGTPELIPGWEDGMAPSWFALAPARPPASSLLAPVALGCTDSKRNFLKCKLSPRAT